MAKTGLGLSKRLGIVEGSEEIFPRKKSLDASGINFVTWISKLATLSAATELFFRRDTVDIVGRFLNESLNSSFGYIVSFVNENENSNDSDFWSDLEFYLAKKGTLNCAPNRRSTAHDTRLMTHHPRDLATLVPPVFSFLCYPTHEWILWITCDHFDRTCIGVFNPKKFCAFLPLKLRHFPEESVLCVKMENGQKCFNILFP